MSYEDGSEEVLLYTKETEYHCLISECTFQGGATCEFIPELKKYEQYKKPLNTMDAPCDMQDDSILIILSDHFAIYIESKNKNGHNTLYLTQSAKQVLSEARKKGVFTQIYEKIRTEQIKNVLDKVQNTTTKGTGIKNNIQKMEETRPTNIDRR